MASSAAAPILFLDVDGVLHPLGPTGAPLLASSEALLQRADDEAAIIGDEHTAAVVHGEFIAPCTSQLRRIVAETGCRIVLSTTWRETPPQRRAVDAQLVAAGCPPSCDCTPRLSVLRGGRPAEILAYVREYAVTRWVALDDVDLRTSSAPAGPVLPDERFVLVPAATGLSQASADEAIRKLQPPLTFDALPQELVVLIMRGGSPRSTLALSACSRALRAASLLDEVWRAHLLEMGFTEMGFALWKTGGGTPPDSVVAPESEWPCWFPSTLLACYHYHHRLHEAVELEVCTDRQSRRWQGCTELVASMEFANPLDVPVWTFFVPCCFAPEHACTLSPWAAGDSFKLFPKSFEASFAGDGRNVHCQGLVNDHEHKRLLLWSFAVAGGVTKEMRENSGHAAFDMYTGWSCFTMVHADRSPYWSQMVRAILMPPRASGRGLVTIAQHLFRLNEQLSAGYHSGELHLEVLQAVDVQVDGRQPLDEYVATATNGSLNAEEVQVHRVMTDAGVTVEGSGSQMRPGWALSNFLRKLDQTDEAITFTPLRRTRVPLRSAARE